MRNAIFAVVAVLILSAAPTVAETQFATPEAVAAMKEDKAKAFEMFATGEGGYKNKDLYVWCANASDGILTVHPTNKGKELRDIKGKHGAPFGEVIMQNAAEGTIKRDDLLVAAPRLGRGSREDDVLHEGWRSVCGVGYYVE